jgi:hypothetical protein
VKEDEKTLCFHAENPHHFLFSKVLISRTESPTSAKPAS